MIDWNDSPTMVAAGAFPVTTGFSIYHAKLLDICFGHYSPNTNDIEPIGKDSLTCEDLDKLAYMVLVEFAASVEKERRGLQEESHVKAEPHPYDVFVMKTSFGADSSNISVLMPMEGGNLWWWNGLADFSPLDKHQHVYRLASLSGSARVLECLSLAQCHSEAADTLSGWAMRRELLVGVESEPSHLSPPASSFIQLVSQLIVGGTQGQVTVDHSILETLNESQKQAVLTVASPKFQEGFLAIQGPPGCGKTSTMIAMIAAIGDGMIVTAPSNAAVANLALKIVESGRFAFPKVCIFGDGCDESVRFLNPRYRSDKYKKAASDCTKLDGIYEQEMEELLKQDVARSPPDAGQRLEDECTRKTNRWMKEKDSIRKSLAHWLHVKDDLSMKELSGLCPDIPLDETGSVSKEGRRRISSLMASAQVLLCTLNSSGSHYFQDAASGSKFNTFLLDEGGQCTEAEFFIATTFPGMKRIIVMGDPKQLRPTVLEPACSSAGYGESWLGRVYQLHPSKIHLLDTQYRMDPAILRFPNQRFYNKRIKSGDNVKARLPAVDNPFLFIDTQQRGREERDENFSYRNSYEIAVIRDILKSDSDICAVLQDNPLARVIIITPYKAQAKLLREMAHSLQSIIKLEVSTVDAFQGQEGEVVILSTVRTKSVGFVDDGQRLNVGLTRAKRVLRIIGDRNFFMGLPSGSTLRALATFATNAESFQATKLRSIPTCPPDLSIQTLWKITLTQRFHSVLGKLPLSDKHVLLNTLFALALPDVKALGNFVVEKEGWHTTWHSGYRNMRVIWVARDHHGVGVIEAHFGGTRDECLRFRQINHLQPDGCCVPRSDMSGVMIKDLPPPENGRMFVSWSLDSHLQNAILGDKVVDLPLSMIQLDPLQETIARSPPPLLIESRSGTGKTLVLLQHAAFYRRVADSRPACFITVSPRLRNELEQRYEELTPIHGVGLPETQFFSFRDFITGLLSYYDITDFEDKDKCTFQGYRMARRSHKRLDIEAHLLENEIGGVIMGSVKAAKQGKPLDRQQYQEDKRSNIPNHTEEGRARRHLVFDEFERYKEWKHTTNQFDIFEAVLRLQNDRPQQLFSSAYLDEVQDLSHAAIYLICGLAGRDHHYWVCGGDPAQMISPGCSFTFDGLKQTLLSLENGIERKLKQVEHLLVNYRTTKDILNLGNQILATARAVFPGAIDFAKPERARKDLGLKVAICSWKAAFDTKPKFGDDQAFIYSSNDHGDLVKDAKIWLDHHPFILSSLESKGLEFLDVVVAFDHDRKTWQLEQKREATLGMLRELYVAVTRAQRRVVILMQDNLPAMAQFFNDLNCDVEYVDDKIFHEFDRDTSTEQWYQRAKKLFNNLNFVLAASCFVRAQRLDWSFLSQGRHLLDNGLKDEAEKEFRRAARLFYDGRHFGNILDVLLRLLSMNSGAWDKCDDKIFLDAIKALPENIQRNEVVKFAIKRAEFSSILVSDLKSPEVAKLLFPYRREVWLKTLVAGCSDDDRVGIARVFPDAVYEFYMGEYKYHEACRIALSAGEYSAADLSTVAFLNQAKKSNNPHGIIQLAGMWKNYGNQGNLRGLSPSSTSLLLKQLFHAPKQVASELKAECTRVLGREIVLLAVDHSKLDRIVLLDFSTTEFKPEIESLLIAKVGPDLMRVFEWYESNGHPALASEFVRDRLREWSSDNLLRIARDVLTRPTWLFEELKRRQLLHASVIFMLLSPFVGELKRTQFLRNYLQFECKHPDSKNRKSQLTSWMSKLESDLDMVLKEMTLKYKMDLESVLTQMTTRGLLVEKALLQMWLDCDVQLAVQLSWEAMETHGLAAANITRVLTLWKEVQQNVSKMAAGKCQRKDTCFNCGGDHLLKECCDSKDEEKIVANKAAFDKDRVENQRHSQLAQVSIASFEDKCFLLMCFFFAVDPIESRRILYLGVQDQFFPLLLVFGPTAAAYCRMLMPPKCHDEELCRRLSEFHVELRSHLRILNMSAMDQGTDVAQQHTTASGRSEMVVAAMAPNEARQLSKKASRKLKQRERKNAAITSATTHLTTHSASKQNKNEKSKKKNKKKGRK